MYLETHDLVDLRLASYNRYVTFALHVKGGLRHYFFSGIQGFLQGPGFEHVCTYYDSFGGPPQTDGHKKKGKNHSDVAENTSS